MPTAINSQMGFNAHSNAPLRSTANELPIKKYYKFTERDAV